MRPSDPIADLLTRIRNACKMQHRFVDVPFSKEKLNIITTLKEQGFIQDFLERKLDSQGTIRVFIKYGTGRKPVIQGLKRVSKPSCRKYVKHNEIPKVLGGMGISILSTSQGVMADRAARERKVGGELICYVW